MKTYEKIIETSLKDTNAYGNIYYSKYFEFAGLLRETFYTSCICNNNPEKIKLYIFATHEASIKYYIDAFPFSIIKMTLNTHNILNASSEFILKFYNQLTNQLLCEGKQTLAILDPSTHKITKVPNWMSKKLKEYELK